MRIRVNEDWWKTLFDEIYLLTDARSVCDEELSSREVDLICRLMAPGKEDRILDMCGGQGRHSLELASRGFAGCTVLDYSQYLVDQGMKTARSRKIEVDFIRSDARDTGLPGSSFDHVMILGNSLGYLPEIDDDLKILKEAYRLLKAGGNLLLDVADGKLVKDSMAPVAWHETDGTVVVCRRRELKGDSVSARELVLCKERGLLRDQAYRVRLFESNDLKGLLTEAGFSTVDVHSDFSPHAGDEDYGFMDKRLLVTAVKGAFD
ncbi:MAG: class I SAM-dependent methyltransferase [bacterium]|nr:MAG: class I SAM-dependent methyltransferase [bacterium]